jgi:uncharacterized protein (DUF305 family)
MPSLLRVFPLLAAVACATASSGGTAGVAVASPGTAAAAAPGAVRASGRPPAPARIINDADVEFMSGMIPHHAQAVVMAGWCKSHGARADVVALCERIVVGQRDEIHLMQFWLRERGLEVPSDTATMHRMNMGGMVHEMLMPGMLTPEEMAALDKARGSAFDRLFLEGMIRHHGGAIDMVNRLMSSPGAAQDDLVYRFSADVYADQTTEIERMQKMLATVPPAGGA